MPSENNEKLNEEPQHYAQTSIEENQPIKQTDDQGKEKTKKSTFKKIFSILYDFLKAFFTWSTFQIVLSHHPICDTYKDHVYKIGPVRLCRGCLLSYPPLYATVIIFFTWPLARTFLLNKPFWIDNLWWFTIGFGLLTIGGYILGRYSLLIKDLSKFGRGAWTGFLFLVIITQHWGFKIGAIVVIIVGMSFLSIKRGKEMERICVECEWSGNFDSCPGYKNFAHTFSKVTAEINAATSSTSNSEQTSVIESIEINDTEAAVKQQEN